MIGFVLLISGHSLDGKWLIKYNCVRNYIRRVDIERNDICHRSDGKCGKRGDEKSPVHGL